MAHFARTGDVVHSPYIPATAAPVRPRDGLRRAIGLSLIAAMVGLPSVGRAQRHTGALSGIVKDSAGIRIHGVEVIVIGTGAATRTDTAGRFLLAGLPRGATDVSLRRIAYEPVVVNIEVVEAETTEVEIRLGALAQSLPSVVVNDHTDRVRTLAAFESRRKTGVGQFITRAEIEKRHPLRLSEMVRTIPGAMIVPAENGRVALRFARSSGACQPQFFLDGQRVTSSFNVDDLPPVDVEGVELYSGPAGLPPEFNHLYDGTVCGTVVIWTRIPGNATPKP